VPPEFPTQRYEEAVAKERFARSVVFLDLPETLCSVEVLPLALRHVVTLDVIRSPFIAGGDTIKPSDVVNFLWIVSPRFERSHLAKRWFALWHLRKVPFNEATVQAIVNFVSDAFEDAGGGGRAGKQFYCTAAGMVDAIASQYGWTEETILNLPIRRAMQYVNASAKRINPQATLFNPSERVLVDWMGERDVWLKEQGKN